VLADVSEHDTRGMRDGFEALAAPAWSDHRRPIRRYIATRLFATWLAYQGRGLRTLVFGAAVALALVRLEAARACARAGRRLDSSLLRDAIRQADLRLIHHVESQRFADRLSAAEGLPS
jgi:hypothetical protein